LSSTTIDLADNNSLINKFICEREKKEAG